MKLLVSKTVASPAPSDFNFLPDGEIVQEGFVVCCNSHSCGCNRSFSGITTMKATTTAEVAEVAITEQELRALIVKNGEESGWGEPVARVRMKGTREAIANIPVGTLVRAFYDPDDEVWVYRSEFRRH